MRLVFATLALWVSATLAWAEIDIKEVKTPGGFTAWLVEEPSIPFAAIELYFRGGASLDAPGKRGAISLMTSLLEEGSGDLDARQFAQERDGLAASFGYSVGADGLTITAQFLSENRDEAIELLRASLISPRFDQEAVERVRQQLLSNIRSDAKDPRSLANKSFNEIAFGTHPYGSFADGSEASVSALTREDLIAAHRATLVRDRVVIGAVGDLDAETLGQIIDRVLGDLPLAEMPLPEKVIPNLAGGTTIIPFETPQSVAVFGHAGIERDHPQFFEAYLLNYILGGGGFESRLTQEVRVKRGLTYGVYAYLAPRDYAATYVGSVSSANDRISEAIEVIQNEWRDIAENGITEEELASAKLYLTGAYPLRFDGNANIASILAGMQAQELPIGYIAGRNDQVNAVTLQSANAVAKWLYQPENLRFVIVGQPEGLEPSD
jgi:zinc protease